LERKGLYEMPEVRENQQMHRNFIFRNPVRINMATMR
jgi:hypothetical protein